LISSRSRFASARGSGAAAIARDTLISIPKPSARSPAASSARNGYLSSAGGAGFEAAAKKAGLVVKTAGPFPINFGDFSVYISEYNQSAPIFKAVEGSETPELAGAAANEKFLTAAFSLASGAVSEPLVLGDYAIVLKVKDASPAKDEDLAGVDYLYPYFYQSKFPADVRNLFMTNKKLKDNFSKTFFKYFYNPSATSSGSSKES